MGILLQNKLHLDHKKIKKQPVKQLFYLVKWMTDLLTSTSTCEDLKAGLVIWFSNMFCSAGWNSLHILISISKLNAISSVEGVGP